MKIGDAEESGKGINTIVNTYSKDVFEYSDTCLIINIPYNKKVLEVIGNENVHQNVHQKSDVEIITSLIKNDNKVTLKEMAISINKSVKIVQRIINKCGNIKYVGSFKLGHWEIVD